MYFASAECYLAFGLLWQLQPPTAPTKKIGMVTIARPEYKTSACSWPVCVWAAACQARGPPAGDHCAAVSYECESVDDRDRWNDFEKAKQLDPLNPKMVVNYKKLKGITCIVLCKPGEEKEY